VRLYFARVTRNPAHCTTGAWETAATINDTWASRRTTTIEDDGTILYKLWTSSAKAATTCSMSVPTGTASFLNRARHPSQSRDWLKINGEAIYNAGPTPFGQEFGDTVEEKDEYARR